MVASHQRSPSRTVQPVDRRVPASVRRHRFGWDHGAGTRPHLGDGGRGQAACGAGELPVGHARTVSCSRGGEAAVRGNRPARDAGLGSSAPCSRSRPAPGPHERDALDERTIDRRGPRPCELAFTNDYWDEGTRASRQRPPRPAGCARNIRRPSSLRAVELESLPEGNCRESEWRQLRAVVSGARSRFRSTSPPQESTPWRSWPGRTRPETSLPG